MRLVFLGTPVLAVPSLRAVLAAGHEVCRVLAQPDRPRDRGQALAPTPIHAAADALGLPCAQPTRLRDPALADALRALAVDAFIVVAYGRLIPAELLDLAPDRWINLHPSLLPRYRGPSPIHGPLLNGDTRTGVTTIVMRPELDAGEIWLQRDTPIGPDETAGDLHDRLAELGAATLVETLAGVERGTITPRPQDHAQATYTTKLTKADGKLDFREGAVALRNRVRAVTPWPGATARLSGMDLKVHRVEAETTDAGARPGTVVQADAAGVAVATGAGVLRILALQRAGKKRLPVDVFLRGQPIRPGARFDLPAPA